MPLLGPATFIAIIYTSVAGLLILLGLPLYFRWIPPNRFYGFRTGRTLAKPEVWYAVNRVTGGWLIITGALTAGVATTAQRLNLSLPAAATTNCATVIAGMLLMLVQSVRTLTRVK